MVDMANLINKISDIVEAFALHNSPLQQKKCC